MFVPNDPNVNNNPMPLHNHTNVNMVELDNGQKLITSVSELKTPLIEIKNVLMKNDTFPICTTTYGYCLVDSQQCESLKTIIQNLINQGILLIDRPFTLKDVSTLEIPYDEVPPLQIPYSLSQLSLSKSYCSNGNNGPNIVPLR